MTKQSPTFLAIGDIVKESPEGPGVVEDISPAGWAKVNGKLVGWLVRDDGLRYNPKGIGALGTDLKLPGDEPPVESVPPLTLTDMYGRKAGMLPEHAAPYGSTQGAQTAPESATLAPEASPAPVAAVDEAAAWPAPAAPTIEQAAAAAAPAEVPAAATPAPKTTRRVPRAPLPSKDE